MNAVRIPPEGWVKVHDDAGKTVFLYDPARDLIEVRWQGLTSIIDLKQYKSSGNCREQNRLRKTR